MGKEVKNDKKRLLRLPKKLDEAVEKRADKNNRSFNSQVIHELQQKD
jgi:hypothetical protein